MNLPCKSERTSRPPIASPACRRFFPQCINLGLPRGSTPTANAAAFVSCLCYRKTRISGTLVAWITRWRVFTCNEAAARLECYQMSFHFGGGVAHKPRYALAVGVFRTPTRLAPAHLLVPLAWGAESGAGLRPLFKIWSLSLSNDRSVLFCSMRYPCAPRNKDTP